MFCLSLVSCDTIAEFRKVIIYLILNYFSSKLSLDHTHAVFLVTLSVALAFALVYNINELGGKYYFTVSYILTGSKM